MTSQTILAYAAVALAAAVVLATYWLGGIRIGRRAAREADRTASRTRSARP